MPWHARLLITTIISGLLVLLWISTSDTPKEVPPPPAKNIWEDVNPETNAEIENWSGGVVIHFLPDLNALQRRFQLTYPHSDLKVLGFRTKDKDTGVCHIWVLKPKWVNDPYTTIVGHEIMHCVWEQYHK